MEANVPRNHKKDQLFHHVQLTFFSLLFHRMILVAGDFDFEDRRVGVHEWQIMKPSEQCYNYLVVDIFYDICVYVICVAAECCR